MTSKCDVVYLWSSGVPGIYIGPKLSSLVYLFSLNLWLCTLDLRPVYFIYCLVYVYFLMFWYSRIVSLINVMEWFFRSTLSKPFFKVTIWSSSTIGSKGSIYWENFTLSFLKGRIIMGMKLIDLLFINTAQTTADPLFQSNFCSFIPSNSGTPAACSNHRLT